MVAVYVSFYPPFSRLVLWFTYTHTHFNWPFSQVKLLSSMLLFKCHYVCRVINGCFIQLPIHSSIHQKLYSFFTSQLPWFLYRIEMEVLNFTFEPKSVKLDWYFVVGFTCAILFISLSSFICLFVLLFVCYADCGLRTADTKRRSEHKKKLFEYKLNYSVPSFINDELKCVHHPKRSALTKCNKTYY